MEFKEAITRLGDSGIPELLGEDVVKLIVTLDPTLANVSGYMQILDETHSPYELLRDPKSRAKIIMSQSRPVAVELGRLFGVEDSGDLFSKLVSLPFPKGSDRESELMKFFNVEILRPPTTEPLAEFNDITPKRVGFNYQRHAIAEVSRKFSNGENRVLLHMPTGSGKTRTAMDLICHLMVQNPGKIFIWLAYSDELCEQACSEFDEAWSTLGDREMRVYRYWGSSNPDLETVHEGLIVAGLAKMHNARIRDPRLLVDIASRTELGVIDEAHQAIAATYEKVLQILLWGRETKLLGLSATPGRTWNDPEKDLQLADYFNRCKVSLKIEGHENPIDALIDRGYLARPKFISLNVNSPKGLTEADLSEIADSLEISQKILEKLSRDEQRNLLIIRKLEELAQRHKRIIVFAATVKHSNLIAALLTARKHDAKSVTGATPTMERQARIKHFQKPSDQTVFLCNFGVLTTGFDAPLTSAAVIARPTKSLVLYSQMVGRALRGIHQGGNLAAEIVTVVDSNLPGFGNLGEAFMNWEDVWDDE